MVVEGMMVAPLTFHMSPMEEDWDTATRSLGESWSGWTRLGLTPEEGWAVFELYWPCSEPNLKEVS